MTDLDPTTRTELEAAAFRALMDHLLVKRARMQGFVIFDHADRHEAAYADIAGWLRAGKLKYLEDILEGMENAPGAIAGLYRGDNYGKRLVRIAPDDVNAEISSPA